MKRPARLLLIAVAVLIPLGFSEPTLRNTTEEKEEDGGRIYRFVLSLETYPAAGTGPAPEEQTESAARSRILDESVFMIFTSWVVGLVRSLPPPLGTYDSGIPLKPGARRVSLLGLCAHWYE